MSIARIVESLRQELPVKFSHGLHHTITFKEVSDAAKIVDALECWSIVELLRAPEGAEVILFCDNPEPIAGTSPNNAIEVCDDWTGWNRRRFEGDSILDALRGAKAAHDAHVEIGRVRTPPGCVQMARAKAASKAGYICSFPNCGCVADGFVDDPEASNNG